jgi:hypothetical protein
VRTKKASPRERSDSRKPFPEGRAARPQADGDPDFAGDRSAAAEDIVQTGSSENDGWSGAEDHLENRPPGSADRAVSDPHHRGDRRS